MNDELGIKLANDTTGQPASEIPPPQQSESDGDGLGNGKVGTPPPLPDDAARAWESADQAAQFDQATPDGQGSKQDGGAMPPGKDADPAYDLEAMRPNGVGKGDPLWAGLKNVAQEHGFSQKQTAGLLEMWNTLLAKQVQINRLDQQMAREDLGDLITEAGDNFNFRARQAHADIKKLAEAAGAPGLYNLLLSRGLLSRPEVLRFGMGLSGIVGDDSFVSGERSAPAELDRTPGGEPLLTFNM